MDSNDCLWKETINTSGAWVATLQHCPPTGGSVLMEDGTYILLEDGANKITVE
jgi:hypothetical protein